MTEELVTRRDISGEGFAEAIQELEASGVTMTATSLDFTNPDLPYDVWNRLGPVFGAVKRTTSWLIGDWINFGEAVYGEKYVQAVAATGLTNGTLRNYASVCGRVARSCRREELSFGHHEVVARLAPKEQKKWLAKAIKNGWLRKDLRDALDAAGEAPPPLEQPDWTPGLTDPQAPVEGSGQAPAGSPLAVLTATSTNGSWGESTLTLVGTSTPAFADLVRRLIEEAIPQGWYVRVPRSTFDELAAFFAEE